MRSLPLRLLAVAVLVVALMLLASAAMAVPPDAGPGAWATIAIQKAELIAGDGASSDCLGSAVAIDGDTAVVGAFNRDVDGNVSQGAAYVFTRSSSD